MSTPSPLSAVERLARAVKMAAQGWCVRCEDAPVDRDAALCARCVSGDS